MVILSSRCLSQFHLCLPWFMCLLIPIVYSHQTHQLHDANYVNNCGNRQRTVYENLTHGVIKNYENGTLRCEWLIAIGNEFPTTKTTNVSDNGRLRYINLRVHFEEEKEDDERSEKSSDAYVLYIFDGASYESALIGSLSGRSASLRSLTATSGFMLLLQYWPEEEDNSYQRRPSSFVAEFDITECPLDCSGHGTCIHNSCVCDHAWNGPACQLEACPANCSFAGHCAATTDHAAVVDSGNKVSCHRSLDQDIHHHRCQCFPEFIGQSCDVRKTENHSSNGDSRNKQRKQLALSANGVRSSTWKLFARIFPGRASHASVYDPISDSIYTYGGRNYETIFSDLIVYSVQNNRWYNISSCDGLRSDGESDHDDNLHDDGDITKRYPPPLWAHTLNIFNSTLLLFGGITVDGSHSNDLWLFDLRRQRWSVRPAARGSVIPCLAFHTATLVADRWLYIFGGRLQDGSHSGRIYRINLSRTDSQRWETVMPASASTTGDDDDDSGSGANRRRLSGHTAIFYRPLWSIVVFGGAWLSSRSSHLSNDIYLFNVRNKIWSKLSSPTSSSSSSSVPSERAFHSMLLLDHYLLVFGGSTRCNGDHNRNMTCHDNRLYLYSLICHKWSTLADDFANFSLPAAPISATLIARENLLFTIGGYSGHLHDEVLLIRIPRTALAVTPFEKCWQMQSKSACEKQQHQSSQRRQSLQPFCFWCPNIAKAGGNITGYCDHYELKCSGQMSPSHDICPGLCDSLLSCYSCVTYKSSDIDSRNVYDAESMTHTGCMWDPFEHRCVRNNISEFSRFTHYLTSYTQCAKHSADSGVTLFKYYYPPNLSDPDRVTILRRFEVRTSFRENHLTLSKNLFFLRNSSTLDDYSAALKRKVTNSASLVNIARILGYVHPFGLPTFGENFLRLYLASSSPYSSLTLNGRSVNLAKNASTDAEPRTLYRSFIDLPINRSTGGSPEDNFLIDLIVKFPIRTTSAALDYETIKLGFETNNGENYDKRHHDGNRFAGNIQTLSGWNLTPFRHPLQCNRTSTCRGCVSNQACAWCPRTGVCIAKTDLGSCASHRFGALLPVVNAAQCVDCGDIFDCKQCVQQEKNVNNNNNRSDTVNCEWLSRDAVCVRSGRFSSIDSSTGASDYFTIRNHALCPRPCHDRITCAACLDDNNYCVWCSGSDGDNRQSHCIPYATYRSAAPSFRFCQSFDAHFRGHNRHYFARLLANFGVTQSHAICDQCLRYSSCAQCRSDRACVWCYSRLDSSRGYCSQSSSAQEKACNLAERSSISEFAIVTINDTITTCPLVNECNLGKHNCDTNARCIDTEQSFKCVCERGYVGDGVMCVRTCAENCTHGYCSEFPDFRCICDLGWTGSDCGVDCGCNQHSTCDRSLNICDKCDHYTTGERCDRCSAGAFGNATDHAIGCTRCDCNGHGDPSADWCDPTNGQCRCLHHTDGRNCERCKSGYYGDSRNGGHCYLECQHRTLIAAQLEPAFFGSYIRQIHFSASPQHRNTHNIDNYLDQQTDFANFYIDCLWIFTSYDVFNDGNSSTNAKSSVEMFTRNYAKLKHQQHQPIQITIFASTRLNCSLSRVTVFDGIPRFVSASNETHSNLLINNLCGNRARTETHLVGISGFVTVLYHGENLYQGFNASFVKQTSYSSPTQQNSSISLPESKPIFNQNKNSETKKDYHIFWFIRKLYASEPSDSLWPKRTHTQFALPHDDGLLFVGGQEENRAHLKVTIFNITTKSWYEAIDNDDRSPKSEPSNRILYASDRWRETIYVYGGLIASTNEAMNDLWSCVRTAASRADRNRWLCRWTRLSPVGLERIPASIGHTLTAIWLPSAQQSALLLIGGYSPTSGFLDHHPFVCLLKSNQCKHLRTQGAGPVGIFAHSVTYNAALRTVFVFGGFDFTDIQRQTTLSNTLYALHLDRLVWRRTTARGIRDHLQWPRPQYFSSTVSTSQYLLTLGGKTGRPDNEDNNNSNAEIGSRDTIFAYRYRCSNWIPIKRLRLFSARSQKVFSASIFEGKDHYSSVLHVYRRTFDVTSAASVTASITAISLPTDLCSLYSRREKECRSVPGCVFRITNLVTNISQSDCIDDQRLASYNSIDTRILVSNETIVEGTRCFTEHDQSRINCSQFDNCIDCVTRNHFDLSDRFCRWCTDCRQHEGRCIALDHTCYEDNHNDQVDYEDGQHNGDHWLGHMLNSNDSKSPQNDDCEQMSIELTSMCPLRQCLATDCNKCIRHRSSLNSLESSTESYWDARSDVEAAPECVWTRQVYKFARFGHTISMNPMFGWTCVRSAIVQLSSPLLADVEAVPPLHCPARCDTHQTCATCLRDTVSDTAKVIHDRDRVIRECVWSETAQLCMSPTAAWLRCETSHDGATCDGNLVGDAAMGVAIHYHQLYSAQCPIACESFDRAANCLTVRHCGWCAIGGFDLDGFGVCVRGGLFGAASDHEACTSQNRHLLQLLRNRSFYKPIDQFVADWHFLYPPKENECLNGHHSCDNISQECVDLDDGFMCRCRAGFKMLKNICTPICPQGCVHGICVQPNLCQCNFGYVGPDCAHACECHGHSMCPSTKMLDKCIECRNNTQGHHCEQCKPLFVGDPRNGGLCETCWDYCNHHSSFCFAKNVLDESSGNDAASAMAQMNELFWKEFTKTVTSGATSGAAICIECQNNTEGERCDRCKLGYFKISDDIRDGCRLCECNQHGDICNPFNGESCNCQNNTENDRQCNYMNTKEYTNYINRTFFFKATQMATTYSLPCWKVQCSKCRDSFYGVPIDGHQCYRHMYPDKEYCLNSASQDDCVTVVKPRGLPHGRVVFFGVQPRYMNVDIRIVISVTAGEIDLYLASKDDMFIVKVDDAGFHRTFIDRNFIQPQFLLNASSMRTGNVITANRRSPGGDLQWLSLDDAVFAAYNYSLKSPFYLRTQRLKSSSPHYFTVGSLHEIALIRGVRQRLEVTIPYRTHDLRITRFYMAIRGAGGRKRDNSFIDESNSIGVVLMRQDQCRIDLFVFFSVFFSCFFLFGCVSMTLWKLKQLFDQRRAAHLHEIELEHMASRPFSHIFIALDDPDHFCGADFRPFISAPTPVAVTMPPTDGTPAKKFSSLLHHFTLGFKESRKIYPEVPVSQTPLSISKNGDIDQSDTTPQWQHPPDQPPHRNIRPLSMEPTSDGLAAIFTTLVQFPADIYGRHALAAASALVSLKSSRSLSQQQSLRHQQMSPLKRR